MDKKTDEFVRLLTASQRSLYACVFSLVPDRVAAHDILQEVNLTLWQKIEEFSPGTDFMAWAVRVVHFRVLTYRRAQRRDRLVFNEELFAALCERQEASVEQSTARNEAMLGCLEKLSVDHREVVEARYGIGGSVKKIADLRGQTAGAVSQLLHRIRQALLECMSRRASQEAL